MKILINGLIIDEKKAGIGHYGFNLINSIVKHGLFDYTLLLQREIEIEEKKKHVNIIKRKNFKNSRERIIDEQTRMLKDYRKHDLMHFLDYSSPVIKMKKPYIITIHDLSYYKYPDMFTKGSCLLKKSITPRSIKNAKKIIAVSENTKKDLIEIFPKAADKIKVIYPGVPEVRRVVDSVEILTIKKIFHIKGRYILAVGTLEPRKNLKRLIKSFEMIANTYKDLSLVIVGKKGWLYEEIFKVIKNLDLRQRIIVTGYVKQQELSGIYSGAELFVYPSLYEGFGLPPLEAMKCGTPVIVSQTSSLPEVVGEAGIYVDPKKIDSIANGIRKGLEDRALINENRKKGLIRAENFTWEKSAKEVIDIYKSILY